MPNQPTHWGFQPPKPQPGKQRIHSVCVTGYSIRQTWHWAGGSAPCYLSNGGLPTMGVEGRTKDLLHVYGRMEYL